MKKMQIDERIYSVASDDNYLDAMGNNFEPHMVKLFRALVGPDDVVADIGANIGLTAILFSTLVRKVFAFEPSLSTYQIHTENLARAGITNVESINLGLGQKAESLTITFAKNNRSGGYVSDKIKPEAGHVTEKIQIDTLDHYFANSEIVPNFLKIDVEGFEQNVIKGGRGFIQKNKPIVVMEMNHFCLDVLQRITIPDFLDYMRSVFPYLYAVDSDNSIIADLHNSEQAYSVMHEHVVRHRFPNLVGGFEKSIKTKLDALAGSANYQTPVVVKPKGKIVSSAMPTSAAISEELYIEVTLSNEGEEDWYGYGTHPVLLSYHWINKDGSHLIYDGLRTELMNPVVCPGKPEREIIRVLAPNEKGTFKLILTVLQEGVCWFEDRGMKCTNGMVAVG